MNRMDEYRILAEELTVLPSRLEGTLARAETRRRSIRRRKLAASSPIAVFAVFLTVFVIMVNISLPFARACGSIPVLSDLAATVAFSSSLSAAAKNNAVQIVNQSQTKNGVTVRILYLIVDQKQLDVFYTVEDTRNRQFAIEPHIRDINTRESLPVSISWGDTAGEKSALRSFAADFSESDMPASLLLECSTSLGSESRTSSGNQLNAADFSFVLRFDPNLVQQGKHLTPNASVVLGGQNFLLSSASIYPTHMQINLDGAAQNTAWLRSLQFYVTDETGRRFDTISNGITATGEANSPAMNAFRCESPFFFISKHLTVHITGAALLDASMQTIRVDLKNAKTSALPEGVTLSKVEQKNGGWGLTFTVKRRQANASYQPFQSTYFDPLGNKKQISEWETLDGMRTDSKTGIQSHDPRVFTVSCSFPNYPYDTVELSPDYSRFVILQKPIDIRVR